MFSMEYGGSLLHRTYMATYMLPTFPIVSNGIQWFAPFLADWLDKISYIGYRISDFGYRISDILFTRGACRLYGEDNVGQGYWGGISYNTPVSSLQYPHKAIQAPPANPYPIRVSQQSTLQVTISIDARETICSNSIHQATDLSTSRRQCNE
jgi:hypothetical protein